MALVVVPVSASAVVRNVLAEFAASLPRGTPAVLGGGATPPLEPVRIVPATDTDWVGEFGPVLARNFLLLPGDPPKPWPQRVLAGIQEGFGHASQLQNATPAVVVLMVLVINDEPGSRAEDVLSVFHQLCDGLDRAAASPRWAGSPFRDAAAARVRLLPWVFVESGDIPRDQVLFHGPAELGCGLVTPLMYHAQATSGALRPWAGYGQARLLTDLLALRALSADQLTLSSVLPDPAAIAGNVPHAFLFHSGLFEFPLVSIAREQILRRLRSGDEAAILPDPAKLDSLENEALNNPIVEQAAQGRFESTRRTLAADTVPDDYFAFGEVHDGRPRFPHGNPPEFELLGPPALKWCGITSTWLSSNPLACAEPIHTRFYRAIVGCTSADPVQRETVKALTSARDAVATERVEIDRVLQGLFAGNDAPGSEAGHGASAGPGATSGGESLGGPKPERPVKDAVGRALAFLRRLDDALVDEHRNMSGAGEDVSFEPAVRAAEGLRQDWINRESALLEAGERAPSLWAIIAEALAVGLGVTTGLWFLLLFREADWSLTLFRVALPPVIGIGAAAGVVWNRSRQNREYLERWIQLRDEFLSDANAVAADLGRRFNRRMRFFKAGHINALRQALSAAAERLRTEIAGLASLIGDEVARLKMLRERRAARSANDDGRFKVEISQTLDVTFDERAFKTYLYSLLRSSLRVADVPLPVILAEYEEALRRQIESTIQQNASLALQFQQAAISQLSQASAYGWDRMRLSGSGAEGGLAGLQRALLVGAAIDARLDPESMAAVQDSANNTGGMRPVLWISSTTNPSTARNLPDEVAISLLVEQWNVPLV